MEIAMKNGAIGNSHEGQAAQRHCLAARPRNKHRSALCSSQNFRIMLLGKEENKVLRES